MKEGERERGREKRGRYIERERDGEREGGFIKISKYFGYNRVRLLCSTCLC